MTVEPSTAANPGRGRRLAVFVSGSGRTLVNLADRIAAGSLRAEIGCVVASRECRGAEFARDRGIGTRVIAPASLNGDGLAKLLGDNRIDWVVLAGYLNLLPIPQGYENRVVNIHPALLPAFGGPGMYGHHVHNAVIHAGCKVSGCTVHLCNSQYDRGPIVAQATCEVLEGDTADSLAARVFALELELYPMALSLLLDGRVRVEGGRTRIV